MARDPFTALAGVVTARRDLYTDLLRIAEHNVRVRDAIDRCESGCTAPISVTVPAPLCEACAEAMDPDQWLRCSRCERVMPRSSFHKLASAKSGHHSHCKKCHAASARASRASTAALGKP